MSLETIDEVCNELGMSKEQFSEAFQELKGTGFLFSLAPSAKELFSGQVPFRIAFHPPAVQGKKGEVTLGPFAVSRAFYEEQYFSLKDSLSKEAFYVIMAIKKLEYEKLGVIHGPFEQVTNFRFEAKDEDLAKLLDLIKYWDLASPLVYEYFVWFVPRNDLRNTIGKIDEKYLKNDRWWNVRCDISDSLIPITMLDVPGLYSNIPTIILESWLKYLPGLAFNACLLVYQSANVNGKWKGFLSRKRVITSFDKALAMVNASNKNMYEIDRNILMKELYDHNGLPFPYDQESLFEFFHVLGLMKSVVRKKQRGVLLIKDPPSPLSIIDIPEGWEDRYKKYIETGSVLFAYLSLEEIIGEN